MMDVQFYFLCVILDKLRDTDYSVYYVVFDGIGTSFMNGMLNSVTYCLLHLNLVKWVEGRHKTTFSMMLFSHIF